MSEKQWTHQDTRQWWEERDRRTPGSGAYVPPVSDEDDDPRARWAEARENDDEVEPE